MYNTGKEAFGDDPPVHVADEDKHFNSFKGWDEWDTYNDPYITQAIKPVANQTLYGTGYSYHLASSILLGFAVVGAVLLIAGVVVEARGPAGKSSEQ
jgi:hypothetical protein